MITRIDELNVAIEKHGLGMGAELIRNHAKPCFYLHIGEKEKYKKIGNSRVGGVPDLPAEWEWPSVEKGYLNFVMQINCSDLSAFEGNPLPRTGILYFFVQTDENGELTRVLYFDGDLSSLKKHKGYRNSQYTCEDFNNLKPFIIQVHQGLTIPGYPAEMYDELKATLETAEKRDVSDRYFDLMTELSGVTGDEQLVGRFLGYIDRYGGDPREDAVLLKKGHACIAGHTHETIEEVQESLALHEANGRAQTVQFCKEVIESLTWYHSNVEWVREEMQKWIPFWFIESNMNVRLVIQDAGRFEILIRKDDLKCKNFSNVHVDLQSS